MSYFASKYFGSKYFSSKYFGATQVRNASLNIVEGADLVSLSAQLVVTSTLNVSELPDVLSFNVTNVINSNLNISEGSDVFSLNAKVENSSVLSVIEDPDIVSVSLSSIVTSALNTVEAPDTISFNLDNIVNSNLNVTEAADVVSLGLTSTNNTTLTVIELPDVVSINTTLEVAFNTEILEESDTFSFTFDVEEIDKPDPIFSLLLDRVLYRKMVLNDKDGAVIDGTYYPSDEFLTIYPTFEAEWEPFAGDQETKVLPEGVSSDGAVMIFSECELQVARNHKGRFIEGDVVYLEDPVVNPTTQEYIVFDKEEFTESTNSGMPDFELLDEDSFDYICVRKPIE